jgi:peptidoglycan/xylan/chitin deacetylase (PgdA/CDA1 family)
VTLILTYHELADDPSPLCTRPAVFEAHLRTIVESGVPTLTVGELAEHLLAGSLPDPAVVVTFDDGFARAVREARPLLETYGVRATFFCVAAYLGGESDWPSRLPRDPVWPLADAGELGPLAADGHEIGSHGLTHAALATADDDALWDEVVASREALEVATGATIRSFAYPFGATSRSASAVVGANYAAGCTTELRALRPTDPLHLLPRVDAHYLRRPQLLHRALRGSATSYLRGRRVAARARRVLRRDYGTAPSGS